MQYDAIYLCSALVLPEYRGKGIAKRLACTAIEAIQADHPIKSLVCWAFSREGEALATSIAREVGIPLLQRPG
jgi:GNAT superfamily N-acetyltransferase